MLGHLKEAAAQYEALLDRNACSEETLESLAVFVCRYPEVHPSLTRFLALARGDDLRGCSPNLQYAVVRSCVECDPDLARKLIKGIEVYCIDSSEITIDLAIQAFRLGQWAKAVEFSRHALTLHPEHDAALRVLVSGLSFQGRLSDALEQRGRMKAASPPLKLTHRVLVAIRDILAGDPGNKYTSMLVTDEPAKGKNLQIRPLDIERQWDHLPSMPGQSPPVLTVSVIRKLSDQYSLWEQAMEADSPWPHVVVQGVHPRPVLHAFLETSGNEDWPWEEVPIAIEADAAPEAKSLFEFMAVPLRTVVNQTIRENTLWKDVLRELRELPSERESLNAC